MATRETTATSNLPESTRLAVERTWLAHERTLMAWVRTATSLISFGFTIYKFFEYLRQDGSSSAPPEMLGTRHFALLMIVTGLVALVVATIQHRQNMRGAAGGVRRRAVFARGHHGGADRAPRLVGLLSVVFRQ